MPVCYRVEHREGMRGSRQLNPAVESVPSSSSPRPRTPRSDVDVACMISTVGCCGASEDQSRMVMLYKQRWR